MEESLPSLNSQRAGSQSELALSTVVTASSRGKESAWEPQVPPPPQTPSTSKAGRSGIQALLSSPTLLPGLNFFPFKVNLQTGSGFVHGHPSQILNVFSFSVEPWEISRKAGNALCKPSRDLFPFSVPTSFPARGCVTEQQHQLHLLYL